MEGVDLLFLSFAFKRLITGLGHVWTGSVGMTFGNTSEIEMVDG